MFRPLSDSRSRSSPGPDYTMDIRPAGNRHLTDQRERTDRVVSACRVRMRSRPVCLIAMTARFLEPFEFDYDDGKRPMTGDVVERSR